MSDSLIAQVRTLVQSTRPLCNPNIAHADEDGDTTCRHCGIGMYCGEERHCSSQKSPYDALLAHMRAQQAVVDAAREFMAADWYIDSEPLTAKELTQVNKLRNALDAALENLKPRSDNDGK